MKTETPLLRLRQQFSHIPIPDIMRAVYEAMKKHSVDTSRHTILTGAEWGLENLDKVRKEIKQWQA
jgi:hypothetical protein